MLDMLLSYKWWILGVSETIAWIATYYMFHAKIVLKSNFRFRLFTVIAGITGYGPHFGLGIYDYITTKKVDLFLIVIAVILIIGFIFWRQIETTIENLVNKLHRNKTKKVKRSRNIEIEKKNKLYKG